MLDQQIGRLGAHPQGDRRVRQHGADVHLRQRLLPRRAPDAAGQAGPHEPSLRVPYLVAGPGIPQGRRLDPIRRADIAATILDLGGARPRTPPTGPRSVPSFTARPGLAGAGGESKNLSTAGDKDPPGGPAAGLRRADRQRRPHRPWKYVRYVNGDAETLRPHRDPNELDNVYGRPRYAGVQAELAGCGSVPGLRRRDLPRASPPLPPGRSRAAGPEHPHPGARRRGPLRRTGAVAAHPVQVGDHPAPQQVRRPAAVGVDGPDARAGMGTEGPRTVAVERDPSPESSDHDGESSTSGVRRPGGSRSRRGARRTRHGWRPGPRWNGCRRSRRRRVTSPAGPPRRPRG